MRFHRWRANLKILHIEEFKAVPFTPVRHSFIERLIGSLQRELLNQLFFWNPVDLDRKLPSYADYYNTYRCHSGLGGATPNELAGGSKLPIASLASYQCMSPTATACFRHRSPFAQQVRDTHGSVLGGALIGQPTCEHPRDTCN